MNLSKRSEAGCIKLGSEQWYYPKSLRKHMSGAPSPLFFQEILKRVEFGFGGFGFFRLFIYLVLFESFCSLPLSLSQLCHFTVNLIVPKRSSKQDVERNRNHANRICIRLIKDTAREKKHF